MSIIDQQPEPASAILGTPRAHAPVCRNCGAGVDGNYCSTCGQPAHTHPINLHYFWHDIQHGIFHVDRGLLFTIRELFTRPGHAIREFINGKRVKHFKPIAFLFLLSTIYAVLAHYFKVDTFLDELSSGFAHARKDKDSTESFTKVFTWFQQHYAYSALLMLPAFSLASYLAFRKSGFNYLQHVVLNAYATGQRTLVYLLLIPVVWFIDDKAIAMKIHNAEFYLGAVLTFWVYGQFFHKNTLFKNVLLTLLTFFYLGVIFMLAIVVLSFVIKFVQ
ncbi:MAG: DUF3667 domain-containing protein [Rufibacter sp.]